MELYRLHPPENHNEQIASKSVHCIKFMQMCQQKTLQSNGKRLFGSGSPKSHAAGREGSVCKGMHTGHHGMMCPGDPRNAQSDAEDRRSRPLQTLRSRHPAGQRNRSVF